MTEPFKYLHYPKEGGGVARLCMCSDTDRAPTHRLIHDTDVTYWCKRCGLQLPLKLMDVYFQTPEYKVKKAFQLIWEEERLSQEKK